MRSLSDFFIFKLKMFLNKLETVSREGTFCDTVQVPSDAGDKRLILIRN